FVADAGEHPESLAAVAGVAGEPASHRERCAPVLPEEGARSDEELPGRGGRGAARPDVARKGLRERRGEGRFGDELWPAEHAAGGERPHDGATAGELVLHDELEEAARAPVPKTDVQEEPDRPERALDVPPRGEDAPVPAEKALGAASG